MEMRPLGRTGVQVSPLCLGAMMFGAWGNTDHDDSIRIIHRALDAGINFIDTADVYSPRRVRGDRRQGAGRRAARQRRARHQGPRHDGRRPERVRQLAPLDRAARSRTACAACKTDWIDLYQIHRPEPDTDIDETLGALTDLVRAGKVRYIGTSTFPPSQIVEAQWVAERRGRERFVCEQPPYSILVRGDRARRAADLPALRHGRDPVEPARRRLAVRQVPQGRRAAEPSRRAQMLPQRYDLSLPANQRKLDAADALAQLRRRGRHHADRPGARLRARATRP